MMLIYANHNSTDALKIIELSGDRKIAPSKIASRKLPPYGFPLKHYHPENCPPPPEYCPRKIVSRKIAPRKTFPCKIGPRNIDHRQIPHERLPTGEFYPEDCSGMIFP